MKPRTKLSPQTKVRTRATTTLIYAATGIAIAGVISLLALLYFNLGGSQDSWANPTTSGYQKGFTVSIDQSVVAGNNNLYDFPFLIEITDNNLKHTSNGGTVTSADGYDIVFCNAVDTSYLDFQLESYDGASGTVKAWVKIPTLYSFQQTDVLMYFGNSSVTTSQESSDLWTNDYEAVWNFKDNQLSDATANANHGTDYGSASASGKIGYGRYFDGNNDYIEVPNSSSLNITGGELTLQAWVKATIPSNEDAPFLVKGTTMNQEQYMLGVDGGSTNNNINYRVTTTKDHYRYDEGQLQNDTWTHVTMVYENSGDVKKRLRLYVNGVEVADERAQQNIASNTGSLRIGKRLGNDNRFFEGTLDELRVLSRALSENWIETEYNNQNNPTQHITFSLTYNSTGSGSSGSSCNYTEPTLSGYGHRSRVTLDASMVSGSADLTDFPVYISLQEDDLRSIVYGGQVHNPNGYDIVFTAADGVTELDHYIISYNEVTGAYQARVRVPTLSATTPTELFVYYGLSGVTADPSTTDTWTSEYEGVWTLDNNGEDATANAHHFNQVYSSPQDTTGKVGRARFFDGNNDYYEDTDGNQYLNGLSAFTTSLWVKSENIGVDQDLYYARNRGAGGDDNFGLRYDAGGWACGGSSLIKGSIRASQDQQFESGNNLQTTDWQHIVVSWSSGGDQRLYIDGVLQSVTCFNNNNIGGSLGNTNRLILGVGTKNAYWHGFIDEYQIANVQRSDDWITTQYNNENDPASYTNWGCSQAINGVGGGQVLPIELDYFTATLNDWGEVDLEWRTLIEINNDFFTIEHSTNGVDFEALEELPGAGNNDIPIAYATVDPHPANGYNYYRLKQTDYNGEFEYFQIEEVYVERENQAQVLQKAYPNPFQDQVQVDIELQDDFVGQLLVVNLQGQVLYQQAVDLWSGRHTLTVPSTPAMRPGQYMLYLSDGNWQSESLRLIKQ